jgi:hypothetical protein
MVPLDESYFTVESILELKKHLTGGGCRYSKIIDVGNRNYSNAIPKDDEWCFYCYGHWLKQKKANLRKQA